ncbi:MAG: hypothetical protein KJ623_03125 [Nanoarchaeota archaeon]|nr:hypothetical protein [Nanoarchaeota archaeon]MBU0962908.1 hypothetical protein [Nanoarchaeota archaeon]
MSVITEKEIRNINGKEYTSKRSSERSRDCVKFMQDPRLGISYFHDQFATFKTNCKDADGHPYAADYSLTIKYRREE